MRNQGVLLSTLIVGGFTIGIGLVLIMDHNVVGFASIASGLIVISSAWSSIQRQIKNMTDYKSLYQQSSKQVDDLLEVARKQQKNVNDATEGFQRATAEMLKYRDLYINSKN